MGREPYIKTPEPLAIISIVAANMYNHWTVSKRAV